MPAARVMVIDDDEDIRTLVCLVLEIEGYRPMAASDGLDALRILNESPLPSLILLDVMMPRMSGEELVSVLRSSPRLAGIPIVIMSGHNDAREKARALAAHRCLVKPVDVDVLLSTVHHFTDAQSSS